MDERIEAFLSDVLALEGEDANAIRQGVRVALADSEQIFRAQEVNKRMKEKAAHACYALCRTPLALLHSRRYLEQLGCSLRFGPRLPAQPGGLCPLLLRATAIDGSLVEPQPEPVASARLLSPGFPPIALYDRAE